MNMFAGIGLTMGPVVASVIQFWLEYVGILYFFAVLIFVIGMLSVCFIPKSIDADVPDGEEEEPMADVPYLDFLKTPRVAMALIVYFMVAIFYMFYDPILSLRLSDIGVQDAYLGLGFAVTDATSSIGAPFIGWIASHVDNRVVILVSLFSISAAVYLSTGIPGEESLIITYIGLGIQGVAVAGIWVPIIPEILQTAEEAWQ